MVIKQSIGYMLARTRYDLVYIDAGIISAMAFSPSHTGMLAMGSYSQRTAIYREDNMELLYVLHGQEGGITHVSQDSFFTFRSLEKIMK